MKTILYITVNTINNKIYIGVHSTKNPDIFDGYLGCGCYFNQPSTYKNSKTPFQYAINKYGVNAFRRYTLAVFDTAEEAFSLESKIVNEEFIKKPYVYNAIVGGKKVQINLLLFTNMILKELLLILIVRIKKLRNVLVALQLVLKMRLNLNLLHKKVYEQPIIHLN